MPLTADNDRRARYLIARHLTGQDKDTITREQSFETDLKADSLDMIELVMGFEEEFEIEITDDEAEEVKTVGDAMDLLAKKLEN